MHLPILETRTVLLWLVACVLLGGCAGTVKLDQRVQGDVSRLEGVAQVVALMSPEAAKQQVDNPQFNREELASRLRLRLEARSLTSPGATHRVEIVLTDIRVRGAFAAIMFGFMAGDDHVVGRVRVVDASGRALRSFEINASYAFGGVAGGQDSVRINWLYDKFADLAADELQKVISPPVGGGTAIAAAPANAAPTPRPVVAMPLNSVQLVSTGVALDNVEAVPVSERGRAAYREWLTHSKPRAFVISSNGWFYGLWGTKPPDPMEPTDPLERGMKRCQEAGRPDCTPYAVDDRVVYIRPSLNAPR
ncbi:MAG: DUF4410 domain-containing protein [Caldimonas sp.]